MKKHAYHIRAIEKIRVIFFYFSYLRITIYKCIDKYILSSYLCELVCK